MWFWFCVTPRRIAYYFQGVIYPQLGTTGLNNAVFNRLKFDFEFAFRADFNLHEIRFFLFA